MINRRLSRLENINSNISIKTNKVYERLEKRLKDLTLNSSVISISAFLILGLASDLLHNHSVVWLMYFLLSDMNE